MAEEGKDDEGIVAFSGWGALMMPMVAADSKRVDSLKLMAQSIANLTRKRITLIKFSVREDVETIEPSYIPLKG